MRSWVLGLALGLWDVRSRGLVERSHVDPVNRSLALTLFPGAAGGCKMGAVNC